MLFKKKEVEAGDNKAANDVVELGQFRSSDNTDSVEFEELEEIRFCESMLKLMQEN